MVGLTLSSSFDSIVTIYILIPFVLVPQLLLGGAMIKFDDLHESITSKLHVPAVGDLMASRWAYEALAVTQYKENLYEKPLFELKMQRSQASYVVSYLIPRVEQKLEEAVNHYLENEPYNNTLPKIRDGLAQIYEGAGRSWDPSEISSETFDTTQARVLTNRINILKDYYNDLFQEYGAEYDDMMRNLSDSVGREGLVQLKKQYYNNALADMVLNRNDLSKLYETRTMLIQKKDPVFDYPESRYGRAHFYAPVKFLGNWKIETLWFNIAAIWLMTAVLYVMLIFDVLRKIVDYLGRLNLPILSTRTGK
jgi:hypothetical protein